MPMDALCLSAVCREVEPAVLGGRIDKIYQPSRDEILLQIRGRAGSCRLLLSANPSRPRLQLTDLPRENPARYFRSSMPNKGGSAGLSPGR